MLTVKHINTDGNEYLVECHSFVRERRNDGLTQFLAYGENPLPGDYIATWCGDEEQRTKPSPNHQDIFVMNQHGSTVASYHFSQPEFSRNTESAGEKLAA